MLCYFFSASQMWIVTGKFCYWHFFSDAQQAFCLALLTSFHRCLNPLILSRKIQEFILLPPTSLSIMLSVYTTETVEMSFQKGWIKHLWREGSFNPKMHCPTLKKKKARKQKLKKKKKNTLSYYSKLTTLRMQIQIHKVIFFFKCCEGDAPGCK